MPTIAEIQQAIISLPKADYAQLRRWLSEYDWEEWDRQIEADSEAGELDFLIDDAKEAKRQGTLAIYSERAVLRQEDNPRYTSRQPHTIHRTRSLL